MSAHFSALAYTPSVLRAQREYGGGELARGASDSPAQLGERECAFIAARNSFYLATVSETGWPHVQHRGGPTGFLKVFGPTLLGFADYAGNRQYVSVGNLEQNDRVALILMDYPNRRRLKILGRISSLPAELADPALLVSLGEASDGSRVERAMRIDVAAFDWNCSRHITPRYTEAEWVQHQD